MVFLRLADENYWTKNFKINAHGGHLLLAFTEGTLKRQ